MATRTATTTGSTQTGLWRHVRRLSNALIAVGIAIVLYAGVILAWGDPVTWVWAQWEQHQLAGQLHDLDQRYNRPMPSDQSAALAQLGRDAARLSREAGEGDPLGKLVIGRIGLDVIFVEGTSRLVALDKRPGHYAETPLPGQQGTVGIAGHRTTFGAWFRHIDSIRDGDYIVLQMPYATFRYQVQMHRVVPNTDWSIINPQGYDRLVLSACHPLYSASHRWVVFARAVSVTLQGG